jgi:cysteine desulfurase/selenocysteine lyase
VGEDVGLGAAVRYLEALDWTAIAAFESELLDYASSQVAAVPGVRLIGTARERVSVLSFVLDGVHPHDVGTVLDLQGVAVRASHHCAQPLMRRFGVPGTVRASFALYNTREDVDALVAGLLEVREVFG